jgi:integrase
MTTNITLTEAMIRSAKSPQIGFTELRDGEVGGFGARIGKTTRVFYLRYQFPGEKGKRTRTIGQCRVMPLKEARADAAAIKAEAKKGIDRFATIEPEVTVTIPVLWEAYKKHLETKRGRKPKTVSGYGKLVNRWIAPEFVGKQVHEITYRNVLDLHTKIGDTGATYQANAMVRLLRPMMKWVIKRDELDIKNPAEGIELYREFERDRVLDQEEAARLWTALDAFEYEQRCNPNMIRAIRALIITGCREMEMCSLKWDYVKKTMNELPDSKGGAIKVAKVQAFTDLLADIERVEGNPYVFTSTKRKGGHIDGISPKVWKAILKEAKIENLRPHDLRRSTASFWMNFGGLSIYEVSQQLNHKSLQTTKRYARLLDTTRIKKAEEGAVILDIFTRKPKAA